MRIYDIIEKKRDGNKLSKEEISFFVNGFTRGEISKEQASALLMAVFIRGMDEEETVMLTESMARSGDLLDLSAFGNMTADKHSTGGVGDKTSLIVAPVCASLGIKMTKMSGRGLGHTGGTVDKLESIPGYRVDLTVSEFLKQVENIGIALIGQTGNLAPADKKIYALRDVTATVDNISLIASSIMSKKIAAGAKNIVLDVKCGSGAFMKTPEDAEKLARLMVKIGKNCGRSTAALITNMDIPLGSYIGNSLEIKEAVEILKNGGDKTLRTLCVELSAAIISLVFGKSHEEAVNDAEKALNTGIAFDKFKELVSAQGGDISVIDNPELLPVGQYQKDIFAKESGYIVSQDSRKIGEASVILGAGREKYGDPIDCSAGIMLLKKTGDRVSAGEKTATLYTSDKNRLEAAAEMFNEAFKISKTAPEAKPLIFEKIV